MPPERGLAIVHRGIVPPLTHRAHRRALVSELARPQIDRSVLERIRSEEIALADQASQTLLDAIADASDVLTVEQRQTLVGFAMHHAR